MATKTQTMTGQELLEIRAATKLNQKDFGIALGFTPDGAQRSVCALETGERTIKPSIEKLANFIKKHGLSK